MTMKFKRFLSVLLALILCIACCNVMFVYANEKVEPSTEIYNNEVQDIVDNKETEKLVVSDMFMSYIDKAEFESNNYTVRLEEKEKLNTYVFQNADKTTSVYYFSENLKYIDDSGNVVEKDLSIIKAENGYTINKSDIDIHLPNTLALGVAVGYNDFSIEIIPISASKVTSLDKAENADGSVIYSGVFGDNTKLVYTPVLSGLKEDIILSEYVPNAKFSFTIKTNGLGIVEKDGQYYLAESGKSDSIFKLGDVVAYDAVGKPSIGSMVVKTIKDCSEYIVTLEVDEEFLKDSGTVYPVTIDPTITVSDNTYGAGAIEDAPIYQGYPNRNFGTYLYNPVGTPSADFGVGRTVVRLNGLISSDEYKSITSDQITKVTFNVREGSGSGMSYFVNIHPMITDTNWTESNINWNTAQGYAAFSNDGGTLNVGQSSALDITYLVKQWKNGTYLANAGFIMISSDESVNRNFLSSEYSTTSYRPYVVMTYDAAITLNYSSVTLVEGNTKTLTATTRPSGQTVTWSTSNDTLATVNSNGVVTAKTAGNVTITATMVDSSGITHYAECTVCVVLPDGVYYIKNKDSNYYLTTSGDGVVTQDVYQYSKYSSNTSELSRIRQMWKIKHLGSGLYSVRPYNKLNMGLCTTNNSGLTYDDVYASSMGTTDTVSGVSQLAIWRITNAFGGYIFENNVTDACMRIASSSTALNASIITHFFTMSDNCLWELSKISSPPAGAYLYDMSNNTIVTTATVSIDVGTTKTLSQLGLSAVAYSGTNISQSFTWSSSDTTVATVSSNGAVTGVSSGITTITGYVYRNNTYYYVSYTIRVGYPSLFKLLIDRGDTIDIDNVDFTDDGLFLTTTSISTILVNNGIGYLPEDANYTAECNVNNFFDDWYIYVIKNGATEAYGLYKMREQEYDGYDGDDPGVTISFVAFDSTKLTNCLNSNTNANKYALYQALTKSTGPAVYEHSDILVDYFENTSSDGAYLIAEKAINLFVNSYTGNVIAAPQKLIDMFEKVENIENGLDSDDKYLEWYKRVPEALESINNVAGREIYDFDAHTITVQNKSNLTMHEKYTILACFTGDVTFNSFAAEVEFHAYAVNSWQNMIPSELIDWYASAIRADMAIGESDYMGVYEDYYDLNSQLIQGHIAAHGEY